VKGKIILIAESGSDIPKEIAKELNVILIPMHVCMGTRTYADGDFPPEYICDYYERTGKIPTTSGSTIHDFQTVYDMIFAANPNAEVLHLAYSSATTCSYHSSKLALEDKSYKDNVRIIDTKQVSAGQCAVVAAVAAWLKDNPKATLDETARIAELMSEETRMCFVPDNLNYLRAGGRCSNATALVGNLLHLHPCIEIMEGKLFASRKYRGNMCRIARMLLHDFSHKYDLARDKIYFIKTPYLNEDICSILNEEAMSLGFQNITWIKTGCVITCHGGPGAFGIAGYKNNIWIIKDYPLIVE